MSEPSLEEKLDQLYAADPTDFVALRKQLQGELRAAGDKAAATALASARRPSTAMWALNQVARRRAELVDALLERSDELRVAQTQPGADGDAIRDAIRAHRAALSDAAAAADDILGARANDAFREEILSMLRAASSQPETGRELRAGRLVRSDDVAPAFPELTGELAAPAARPARAPRAADAARDEAREAERQIRIDLERARDDEGTADAALADAQRRVNELDEELASAHSELREARTRLRTARAEKARLAKLLERRSRTSG